MNKKVWALIKTVILKALAILDIASDSNKIETLKKEFTSCKIIFQSVDVADILSVERSFHEILGELKKFDILVNAAGILDETNAELCVKVNLVGDCVLLIPRKIDVICFLLNAVGRYKYLSNSNQIHGQTKW